MFEQNDGLLTGLVEVDPMRDNTDKIAAFDMDYTLIKTKSESLDWDILNNRVPTKLRRLHTNGFRIVVFTN